VVPEFATIAILAVGVGVAVGVAGAAVEAVTVSVGVVLDAVVSGCCSEQATSNKAHRKILKLDSMDFVDMMVPPRDSGRTPDYLTVADRQGDIKDSCQS